MKKFVLLMFPIFVACSHGPYVWVKEIAGQRPAQKIDIGDILSVQMKEQAAMSGEFPVRSNGAYLQPAFGEIVVVDLTSAEAAEKIATSIRGIVVNPTVGVSVSTPRPVRVSVVGEVRTPGTYRLLGHGGVLDALARAGGLTEFANSSGIYVIRSKPKHERIRFSYNDLIGGDPASIDFRLRAGDTVSVE